MRGASIVLGVTAATLGRAQFTPIYQSKTYSMNRQELIRDASGFSAHCLIAEENNTPQRVLHAIFEGNSGGFIEFYPEGFTWNGTGQFYFPLIAPTETKSAVIPSAAGDASTFSVESEFKLNFNAYALYSVASSVRNIRDWGENGDPNKGNNPNAGELTVDATNKKVTLRHSWPSVDKDEPEEDHYYVQVDLVPVVPDDVTITEITTNAVGLVDYKSFKVELTDAAAGALFKMTTSTNQPMEEPLGVADVLKPEFHEDSLAEGLVYLSHKAGWVAGSHRFLTYFGRDTLMTLHMLRDKVPEAMFQNVLTAALVRTRLASDESGTLEQWEEKYGADSAGLLCHEDELGAFPWQHPTDPRRWRGDYKMLDTHFLVLPLLAYAQQAGTFDVGAYLQSMATRPLDNTAKPISEFLEANIKQVLAMSKKFADAPSKENLLQIYHATVGNWRDSNEGLYRGVYPMDVNGAFVPAALQAIADHGATWFPDNDYHTTAATYAEVWKREALEFFKVPVPNKEALEAKIQAYVSNAEVTARQGDLSASLRDSSADELPSEYYITVALLDDGRPVGVLSTDYGLLLAYRDDLTEDVVAEAARAARVKFPRGLATEAGLVVSNPAYAWEDGVTDAGLVKSMDRTGYHGTVVWSWQHAMYNMGLKNYLEKYPNSVGDGLTALWDAIEGTLDMVESEMWSWQVNPLTGKFKALDLLEITGSGTEGNVAQLWSYAFIGESRPEVPTVPPTDSSTTEDATADATTTDPKPGAALSWVAGGIGSLSLAVLVGLLA